MTTVNKIHKIIRDHVGVLSSKYSPSQKINRQTYDVKEFKGIFCVMSSSVMIIQIALALKISGFKLDESTINRGFVKVWK
jgi:hypothetical protein